MRTEPIGMRIAIEARTLEEAEVPDNASKVALAGLHEVKHDEHAAAIRDAIVVAMSSLHAQGLRIVGTFTIGKVTKKFTGTE